MSKIYIVNWYDTEGQCERSIVVEAKSTEEAEIMLADGDKYAEDVHASELRACTDCNTISTKTECCNANTFSMPELQKQLDYCENYSDFKTTERVRALLNKFTGMIGETL